MQRAQAGGQQSGTGCAKQSVQVSAPAAKGKAARRRRHSAVRRRWRPGIGAMVYHRGLKERRPETGQEAVGYTAWKN